MAPIAQNGPFWAQKWCFRPKINFSWTASKKIVTLMTGHLKDNLFVLTALQGGLRGGVRALFWAKKWPENQLFLRYFHITRLFWSQTDLTQRNHNIPYPEVTLDTFGRCPFGCSAGRCMAPIAENYHFWAKNAYYYIISHGIV